MKKLISFLILSLTLICGRAQVTPGDTAEYIIKLSNGNEYIGRVLSDDGREMLIQTNSIGKLFVNKADVVSMNKRDTKNTVVVDGEVWENNTFSTRYFFSTNGLPIKKGENYYMIHLYGPEFHVAVSNSVNVGLMTTWIGAPFLFTVKKSFQTRRPDVNFAVGTLTGNLSYITGFKGLLSVNFLSLTKGTRENNLTFSSGIVIANNGVEAKQYQTNVKSSGTLASVAGTLRIGKNASLIFDSMFGVLNSKKTYRDQGSNYYYDPNTQEYVVENYDHGFKTTRSSGAFILLMPGIRVMQSPSKAFQFYMNYSNIDGNRFGFPMVSWLRKF